MATQRVLSGSAMRIAGTYSQASAICRGRSLLVISIIFAEWTFQRLIEGQQDEAEDTAGETSEGRPLS